MKISILEDNQNDYINLETIIKEWGECNHIPIEIDRFTDNNILNAFLTTEYDLLFADIELNKTNLYSGMSLCEDLRKAGYNGEIVFLTAFKEYVFKGYNVRALNYLVKPVSKQTIHSCLQRFLELHSCSYYCLHDRSVYIRIRYSDILYIQKIGHETLIHTINNDHYERNTLNNIRKVLPAQFIMCHKSCLVNMTHVRSIIGNKLHLTNGDTLNIGRSHLPEIRDALLNMSQF